MIDPIEDFVKQNRSLFDDEKPSNQVWARLETQLTEKKQFKKDPKIVRLQKRFTWAAAAAVVFFALTVGFWQQNARLKNQAVSVAQQTPPHAQTKADVLELLPEIKAVKAEFSEDIEQYMNDLKAYPDAEVEVRKELAELDQHFEVLKKELGSDFSSEDVVEAMIDNYRLKLEILERTLGHLKRSSKAVYHEI